MQDFPRELQWMTYLKEWHVQGTKISRLPDYLRLFTQLTVLEIPKNAIAELPPAIGEEETRDLTYEKVLEEICFSVPNQTELQILQSICFFSFSPD